MPIQHTSKVPLIMSWPKVTDPPAEGLKSSAQTAIVGLIAVFSPVSPDAHPVSPATKVQ